MENTKVQYVDSTWNPVTGCRNGCPYCYARTIAHRFRGCDGDGNEELIKYSRTVNGMLVAELDHPLMITGKNGKTRKAPYPFDFTPTFHKYRLNDLKKKHFGKNIFICSTADLFAECVPDEWIGAVFNACLESPEHRYLFLTKNPARYYQLGRAGKLPEDKNFWYGSTADNPYAPFFCSDYHNTFVSFEPLQRPFYRFEDIKRAYGMPDWTIIGAETGNRPGKVIPERFWIENIVNAFQNHGKPIFMKDSLKKIWGNDIFKQFPWDD